MTPLRIRPAGDRALLLEPSDHRDLLPFVDALRRDPPHGVQDVLPAAVTVLVTLTAAADASLVARDLRDLFKDNPIPEDIRRAGVAPSEVRTIGVRYDGPDLAAVATHLGLTPADVVAAHTAARWRCAFLGFAPGFGYLTSDGAALDVPRRPTPRTRVPAGSVALADGYSAVYPRRSPGGWQIIGSTDVRMWDLNRPDPALLRAGTWVRFTDASP